MAITLAFDLGTTGNRVAAFDETGLMIAKSYYEFRQHFPKPAWVEHDAVEIYETLMNALADVLLTINKQAIKAIGISNQRETTVIWDRKTGKPIYNAIVWQCRRSTAICDSLRGHESDIRARTGLSLDPYFSAGKISWLLDHVDGAREAAQNGDLCFGTIDTWILWQLSRGNSHSTDSSNASRTMLYNIRTLDWDDDLLTLFDIPSALLPEVKPSNSTFASVTLPGLDSPIPVTGILGDQQASLFAHCGWQDGIIKNTYGTGLFVVCATGQNIPKTDQLINTIAWNLNGQTTYALEGSIFVGGSAIQWLRDGIKIISDASETDDMATATKQNDGLYFVPAFVGLGAPYWNPNARGMMIGITRGTTEKNIARATLESLAYQSRDVIEAMTACMSSQTFRTLRADGGASQNKFLMQFQADILGLPVEQSMHIESTAFGIAALAGITAGIWTRNDIESIRATRETYTPNMDDNSRREHYTRWQDAVKRSLNWNKT